MSNPFNGNHKCDYLVFDVTNILYRTFYAHKNEDDVTIAGLAAHTALITMNKYFNQFKPRKKVIMCFDRSSWRKEYTASEEAITPKPYKGNRRQKMTPREKQKYEMFLEHINEFETLIRDHTSIVALAADRLEADDLVAGVVQIYSLEENEIVIISADQDFIQLLRYPKVRLIDPASGKDRTLEEWNNDADLFMFEKCIRGDTGDNVMSAYPRLRKNRLLRAYTDELERVNIMQSTWKDHEDREFVVKHVFKENQLLMDLSQQPEDIQKLIIKTVLAGVDNPGTYSYFHFMKFCGTLELKKLAERADTLTPLLSH